ncbi:hypothetical protein ADK57_31055 [Streptomyces sp. MMG1533]|nr:hypothetical protein ADK57_31055 [Streptomyces sp. MMG1533]
MRNAHPSGPLTCAVDDGPAEHSDAASSRRPATSSAKSRTVWSRGRRATAAACLRAARRVLRVTLVATPSSQGRREPPSSATFARSRQASRKVSETTSSASAQSPVSR